MPFNDVSKPAPPLPSPVLTAVLPGVSLLQPLSRRGTGPGMIVLAADYGGDSLAITEGVPSPLVKWAEEGYTVVEIKAEALKAGGSDPIRSAIETLYECDVCEPKDKIGLTGECCLPSILMAKRSRSHRPNSIDSIRCGAVEPRGPNAGQSSFHCRGCCVRGCITGIIAGFHRPRIHTRVATSCRKASRRACPTRQVTQCEEVLLSQRCFVQICHAFSGLLPLQY